MNAPTIVAPATAAVSGGVGIVRISGALSKELATPLVRGLPSELEPRRAYFVELVDGAGQLLDQGLFLFFRAPHSFTGEDVVELHTHGSPRLVQLVVAELLRDGRARLAEPGEFSRRAFLNGRIDLARAEAIADLVSAESEAAVRAAAAQLSGALSERVRALRDPLFALRTDLEGVLNFPDEAEGADEGLVDRLVPLVEHARLLLADAGRGRLVRRGANVVLFGPVNAGKSTLFNRLVGDERALVDDEPGTTRDVLEARLELGGLTVALFDTAGLRERAGRIEALGIARAKDALARADLAVLVVPPRTPAEEIARWRAEAAGVPVLVVEGKSDLGGRGGADAVRAATSVERSGADDRRAAITGEARREAADHLGLVASQSAGRGSAAPKEPADGIALLRVSGKTGAGIDTLRDQVLARLWSGGTPGAVALVSERHADALRRAVESLERATEAARVSTLEVVSGELGLGVEALGEITGETATADLLDAIFRRFCIGK